MQNLYFEKAQKTNESSITKFYYNKYNKNYNNFDFLQNKIKSLLQSEKVTESVKKQLKRLTCVNFALYDCFFIYSNVFCFGIDSQNKIIDFYKNDYDSVIDLQGYTKNYNCKINTKNKTESEKINDFDLLESDD